MKFSISPALSDVDQYLPLARAADELGFANVVVPDAVFYPEKVSADYPYTRDGARFWQPETPWLDPFVAVPAMAAVTERVRFVTSVVKLAIRQPLLVARQVQSIAVLSGNRFTLGVGLGWIPEEFEWCGEDYRTRGKRANEAIEILQLTLAGGMVEYSGEHYSFGKLRIDPAPAEPVPIYVGGHSKPGLRRAAKYADGWTSAMATEREIEGYVAKLGELRAEYGRSSRPFEIQVTCTDVFDAEGFARLEQKGVTDVIVQPWLAYGVPINGSAEDKIAGMRRFAEQIMAKLNG